MDHKRIVVALSGLIGFLITILLIQFGFLKTLLILVITVMTGLLGSWTVDNDIWVSRILKNIFRK